MSKFIVYTLALQTIFAAPTGYSLDFRIVTSNVKVDAPSSDSNEKGWSERKDYQVDALKDEAEKGPTLIGLQESKKNQVDDILHGLNSDSDSSWTYFGVGKDDGREEGEYEAVLYDKQQWELVNGTSKWLSTTPSKPSKSWGAEYSRIVSITEMKHKSTSRHVNFLNTHFDQQSEEARKKSAELILDYIKQIPNKYQTFLSGDFNSGSDGEVHSILSKKLKDAKDTATWKWPSATFTGFDGKSSSVIDMVWVPGDADDSGGGTKVDSYHCVDNTVSKWGDSYRFSDHKPVSVSLKLA